MAKWIKGPNKPDDLSLGPPEPMWSSKLSTYNLKWEAKAGASAATLPNSGKDTR